MKYSPYAEYVGIKIPEGNGWRGALMSDEPNVISIASLTAEGKPVNKSNLKLEIYKLGHLIMNHLLFLRKNDRPLV